MFLFWEVFSASHFFDCFRRFPDDHDADVFGLGQWRDNQDVSMGWGGGSEVLIFTVQRVLMRYHRDPHGMYHNVNLHVLLYSKDSCD